MFKSILVGLGAAFLAIAGPAILPIVVGILSATMGAVVVVGLSAWRSFRRSRRTHETATAAQPAATPTAPKNPTTGRAQWDVRP